MIFIMIIHIDYDTHNISINNNTIINIYIYTIVKVIA